MYPGRLNQAASEPETVEVGRVAGREGSGEHRRKKVPAA